MIFVSMPAYNEEEALPALIETLAQVREELLPDLCAVVIDDGSVDNTAEVIRNLSESYEWLSLVQHNGNKGLAQAIRSAFDYSLERAAPNDVIVTLDADNTQPPHCIADMVEKINKGADVIIASRFQPGAEVHGVPGMRRLYSRVMSILFQVILPIKRVRDYSCGFRAYRASVIQKAYDTYGSEFITEQGFACMVEILVQLNRLKTVTFNEVPFVLRYDMKPTETKMKVLKTIAETLRLALRYQFKSSG